MARIIIELLLDKYNSKKFTSLNVGSGIATSVNQIIDYLSEIHGKEIKVVRKKSDSFWDKYPELFNTNNPLNRTIINKEVNKFSLSDNTNLYAITGIKCETSIKTGLKKCYDHARYYFSK